MSRQPKVDEFDVRQKAALKLVDAEIYRKSGSIDDVDDSGTLEIEHLLASQPLRARSMLNTAVKLSGRLRESEDFADPVKRAACEPALEYRGLKGATAVKRVFIGSSINSCPGRFACLRIDLQPQFERSTGPGVGVTTL